MQSQKLEFENAAGHTLAGRLDVPAGEEPIAYAVFAHCFTCSKNLNAAVRVSQALNRERIAVLRFDFTGLGESEGEFAESTLMSNVDDLVAAASFLDRRYRAPALLVGHSLGGAAVLRAAARIPSARAVATIAAPFDPAHITHLFRGSLDTIEERGEATVRIGGRTLRITRELVRDLERSRSAGVLQGLGRALLVLHSPADEVVPIENAARIYTAEPHPKSFVSLDTADHLLTAEGDASYAGAVLAAWAMRYIETPPPPRTVEALKAEDRVVARTVRGGFRTEITTRGHALVADEPAVVGGTDQGPTPYDLLVAALGACTGMTLRMYAERKEWPLEEVTVRLRHSKVHAQDEAEVESDGARLDRIERELQLAGALDQRQRQRLLEIAERCPVHRTLAAGIDVRTTVA